MGKNGLCFFCAAAALGLLAYGGLGSMAQTFLVLGALTGAFLLAALPGGKPVRRPSEGFGPELSLPWMKPGFVWILLALAFGLRFYRITSYHAWPNGDEALHGFLALGLLSHWNWQFFYTVGQHPPLLIWCLRFLFGWFQSPFAALWFLPALLSALTVLAGYAAARGYFSKSFAWICAFLLGFSFWPLYTGRFCHQGIFVPPLELVCFWLWGKWKRSKTTRQGRFFALALGLVLGAGTWTFTAWGAIVVLMVSTVLWAARKRLSAERKSLGFFGGGLGLTLLPFAIACWHEGYGAHLLDVSSGRGWFSIGQQLRTGFSYGTSVFWGSLQSGGSYGPVWGGLLNPLLGACAVVGFAELWNRRSFLGARWIFAALFLAFLPGLLSADYVEMFRVVQAMPLVLLVAAFGLKRLLLDLPARRRTIALVLVLMGSVGLDAVHFSLGADSAVSVQANENYRAYQLLEAQARRSGPGIIYTDFLLLSHGHSLAVCTYPFNASENKSLDPGQAQWAAVIANVNYGPFLQKRFPQMRWIPVGLDLSSDGGLAVGLVPLTPRDHPLFNQWLEAHDYFHQLNQEAEQILNDPTRYAEVLRHMPEGEKWMGGDPFLESLFGEWRAQYHYGASGYVQNAAILKQTLQAGYPAAHLYFKLGNFLWWDGQKGEAKQAYEKALAAEPAETQARQALALLSTSQ